MKQKVIENRPGFYGVFGVFIILYLSQHAGAANILGIFPYTARSHFAVYAPLLDELWSRGHNLTVISHFPRSLGAHRPGQKGVQQVHNAGQKNGETERYL
ncbi:glucuronosyltransferase [Nesidiocoris tenuis]|nr:glucuronosyltransferase [Nesidiocoris tenuis]